MWKIDIRYFQDYKLAKKEDKDFRKNKFANTLFADVSSKN